MVDVATAWELVPLCSPHQPGAEYHTADSAADKLDGWVSPTHPSTVSHADKCARARPSILGPNGPLRLTARSSSEDYLCPLPQWFRCGGASHNLRSHDIAARLCPSVHRLGERPLVPVSSVGGGRGNVVNRWSLSDMPLRRRLPDPNGDEVIVLKRHVGHS